MWAPSQYKATYSTKAAVSSLDHSAHRPTQSLPFVENKLRLAGFSFPLSIVLSGLRMLSLFYGAVLPGVSPILPWCLLLLISVTCNYRQVEHILGKHVTVSDVHQDNILNREKQTNKHRVKLQNTGPLIYISLNDNSTYCVIPRSKK